MRITKTQLRRIIREEKTKLLKEAPEFQELVERFQDVLDWAQSSGYDAGDIEDALAEAQEYMEMSR